MSKRTGAEILEESTDRLVNLLLEYESDTFSAMGSNLKPKQARRIAAKLIDGIEDELDGVTIAAHLEEL